MVITPYFYPKIGGMENYAYNISKDLKEKYGWEVIIITSNHEEKKYKEEKLSGMKVYRLPRLFKISNTPIDPLWYFQIKKIIKKEKPDVINAHSPVPFMADVAARVCGNVPFVLKYHAGSMKKNKFFLDILIWIYENILIKKTLRKAKKIICSSDFVRLNFLKDYSNKTVTITPGVNIKHFKPEKTNDQNKVLYVGRIEKSSNWKGIKYLLDAIKIVKERIPTVKLNLVGSGNYVDHYRDYSKDIGIEKNIVFAGPLRGKKLLDAYLKTNVLVLPSISEAESFGIVLIEAGACGKPVIGSKIGGIPYVIDDERTGLLVPPKNSEALAEAIIKILKNPKLAKKMGENGYKKVRKYFTWDKQVKKTKEIIENLIKKK